MTSIEKRGKNVQEAISLALEEMGAQEADVSVEILEEPKTGLFGLLGQKDAVVRVTLREVAADLSAEISGNAPTETRAEAAERFLEDVVCSMGITADFETTTEDGYVFINMLGDDLGALIGRRGLTLNALQYLTNLSVVKRSIGDERIVLDVEGYRKRREETLRLLAERLADKVRRTGQSVMLEPMSAQERRVVHTALQNSPYVLTKSEGEEPFRKIVIHSKR